MTHRVDRWITAAQTATRSRASRPGTLDPEGVHAFTEQLAALSLAGPGRSRFGPMTPWVQARIEQVLLPDGPLAEHGQEEQPEGEPVPAERMAVHRSITSIPPKVSLILMVSVG